MKIFSSLLLFFFLLMHHKITAQTVPVGMVGFDDQLKVLQLQGKIGIEHSLMARPFFTSKNFSTDSLLQLTDPEFPYHAKRNTFLNHRITVEALPFQLYTKYNSNRPYSWNQAGFLQAKGLQTIISTGVHFSYGWLDVQIKPEFVYAANAAFPYNSAYGAPTTGTYTKPFLGQSSVRLSKGGVSVGISTENCWWGPGLHNSLLMSNNAPGFLHFTFNSTRPLKTPIGNFEFQLIGGKLTEDTSLLLENKNLTTSYYNPLTYLGDRFSGPNDIKRNWRYLSAVTLTYNPKWVKGLFISINRIGYAYKFNIDSNGTDNNFMQKYFPVLFGVLRQNYPYGTPTGGQGIGYKQMASFSARMVFPKSHSEIYAEYGYGDNFLNLRDWNTDAPHSTAYILGVRKLKKLTQSKGWIDFSAEMTRMAESINYLLRTAGDWYSYEGGYTNQSRIIGAGIGGGNNVYTAKINWFSGFSKLGVLLQRIQHNPTAITDSLNINNNFGQRDIRWNDISVGIYGQKRFNKIILSVEIQSVSAHNYAWIKGRNLFNFYGFLTATYLW